MSTRADNGVSAHLASILCWTFLPSVFTNLLLSTFYRFSPDSKPTLPPNASPSQVADANSTAQRHFRRARITLVVSYLAYSILSVYWSQSAGPNQNYYSLLGVSRDLVERDGPAAVKSHWRRLARVYHPDKVGKQGEQRFVELRRAVDVLEHDGRRWAYERFGPQIAEWRNKLASNREFLAKGATNAAAFWIFAFLSIAGISFFRRDERRNNFWRYLTLVLCSSLEFHFLLRPSPSPTFSFLFPDRLTYEHIALLRQLFISTSMAMSQLTPLLFPLALSSPAGKDDVAGPQTAERALELALEDAEKLKAVLQRLAQLTAAANAEATGLQHLELRPLFLSAADDTEGASNGRGETATREQVDDKRREVVQGVKEQMKRTFEDLQLKSDPVTGPIWEAAVKNARGKVEERAAQDEGDTRRSAIDPARDEREREPKPEFEPADEPTIGALEPFTSVPSPPTSPVLARKELGADEEKCGAGQNQSNLA